ncbi:MAG TPA: amidohydrolase family protein [Solirubrobacterales bacterium]
MTAGQQRIDTHSHWMPPSYVAALRLAAERDAGLARGASMMLGMDERSPLVNLDLRLAEIDAAEVTMSVLSLPPPGMHFPDVGLAVEAAPAINDELIAAAESDGERFCVLAALPLPDVPASIAELNRVASSPAVRGVGLMTQASPWQLDNPPIREVLGAAADLGLPVVLHPQMEDSPPAYGDWGLTACLAPPVSSSLGVLRLILSGCLDQYPELVPIVPHLGGAIPYLFQRIVDLSAADASESFEHCCRERLYYDTCSYHPPALRCAIETVGAGRLMAGSDFPFRGRVARCFEDILQAGLGDREVNAILGGTASQWFGPHSGQERQEGTGE